MKYKVWIDVNVRGTLIVTAPNGDAAAHKAKDKVARAVNRVMRVEPGRGSMSKPGMWFAMMRVASSRDIKNAKARPKARRG